MSNKLIIEKSFNELFKSDDKFIAILSGEWGTGKTYFWEQLSKNLPQSNKQVYISLFGLNSIEEIKTNILFKISKFKKTTNWLNKNIASKLKSIKTVLKLDENTNIPLNMEVIGGLFSLLTQGDFKDIIICFDDIERMSNKIDIKDFMGFLSELKETKDCKVVVILNENELDKISKVEGKSHSEIFAIYKEKIIDYEFHYKPSIKDNFDIAKNLIPIEYFNESKIFEFFIQKNIKNIRVMKQCISHLNKFTFIQECNLDDKTIDEFLISALTVFSFKTIYNLSEKKFEEFKEYIEQRSNALVQYALQNQNTLEGSKKDTKQFKENKEFKSINLNNYQSSNYQSGNYWDKLEELLYQYLYSAIIEKIKITFFLQKQNSNIKYQYIRDEFEDLENRYLYDLKFTNGDYEIELSTILDKHKKNLTKIYSLEELLAYFDFLEKSTINNKENLLKEVLENCIYNIVNTQDNEATNKRNDIDTILNKYSNLNWYVKKYRENYMLEEDLDIFFDRIFYGTNRALLTKKDTIIILNNKDKIKEKAINSPSFFKKVINVIQNHTSDSDIRHLIDIVNELRNGDIGFKTKIQKLEDRLSTFKYSMGEQQNE